MPETTIRVHPSTRSMIKTHSLTHDANGRASESYDSIIRRGMNALDELDHPRIDVSKL